MAILYGHEGRLNTPNGGVLPGPWKEQRAIGTAAVAPVLRVIDIAPDAYRCKAGAVSVAGARRPYCHSALPFSVPIGILRIHENGAMKNDITAPS